MNNVYFIQDYSSMQFNLFSSKQAAFKWAREQYGKNRALIDEEGGWIYDKTIPEKQREDKPLALHGYRWINK